MSEFLFLDLETKSAVDIKQHGAYVYFDCPHADILIARYAFDDGPVERWPIGTPCPPQVKRHIEAGGKVSGWNVFGFERLAFNVLLGPKYGWPVPEIHQYDDTAQMAAAMSLPRNLGDASEALDLPVKKDKDGLRLIRKFSVPRRPRKDEEPDGVYFNAPAEFPGDFQRYDDYCGTDVETERGARKKLVPLSAYEHDMAVIDARINSRGIRVDRNSARAAMRLAARATALLDREMKKATGGAVAACSQVEKLTAWIATRGVPMDSLAKADIEDILETDDLPADVRHVLELRQEAAKTSVSKLRAFLKRCSEDGNIRGAFLFNAAGTGRWSSVGAQLHNLPRPRKEFGDAHPDLAILFWAFRQEDPDYLKLLYGDKLGRTLFLLSDAIRGFLWARPGHDLIAADYAGIEGAVAAWFAGEHWKVEAMHALIADPSQPDLYRRAAAGIFNTTTDLLTKKDVRRQVGKVSELSLQYQGGVGAFRSMARNYSLKIEPVYEPVWEVASEERREKAVKRYEQCLSRGDPTTQQLSRKAWLAAELVKIGWRATHPAIVQSWGLLQDGIREAIENPGKQITVLKVTYLVARGFLWCKLPSGRCLAYGKPRLKDQVWGTHKGEDSSVVLLREEAERLVQKGLFKIEGKARPAATALGVNSVTKKWERFALYGGLAFENIVQAIARDLLAHGIKVAEANGYPVIGHVHDEIIAELPKGEGDLAAFCSMICALPAAYAGLPLSASGWRGKRYRKD